MHDLISHAEKALVDLDAEKLVSLYAPTFVFEDTASKERIETKDGLKAYFDRLFSLPDVSFKDVQFFSLGQRAAGEWIWCGSSLKSGKPYAIRGASLFKLSDDGIVEEIIYYDPKDAHE